LIIQQQSYSIDSNGNPYNYSDYATISSTCRDYESQTFIPEQVTVSDCPSGQVGSNTYTRTYTQWTTGDRSNYTGWVWLSGSCYTPYSDPGTTDTGTTTADTGTTSAPADTYSPPADTGTASAPADTSTVAAADPPPYNPYPDYPDWCCGSGQTYDGWGRRWW